MNKIKIVYAPMACNLIHRGHIEFLKRAKCLGDFLIVGLYSDETVIAYKKVLLMPYAERKAILETIYLVNMVVEDCMDLCPPDTLANLDRFKVDILAYGSTDNSLYQMIKDKKVCKVVQINRYEHVSTSMLVQKVLKEYS